MWRSAITLVISLIISLSASADRFELKTGEWLETSEYKVFSSITGGNSLVLDFKFEEDASSEDLREQSLQELAVRHLLPRAMKQGYASAKLSEQRVGTSWFGLSATVSGDWNFEWQEGWQWEQTGGPEIDWSLVYQERMDAPKFGLSVPKKLLEVRFGEGQRDFQINAILLAETKPEDALQLAAELLVQYTRCDLPEEEQADYLLDENLNGIFAYVRPKLRRDMLDLTPNVHFSVGRLDGVWPCDLRAKMEQIENTDWTELSAWDDFLPRRESLK